MDEYDKYLASKTVLAPVKGFEVRQDEINPACFQFQKDMIIWKLRGGRRLNACQCGFGKTLMELEVCHQIAKRYGPTIIFTRVLRVKEGRDEKDEKHLCPLQLDVIERALVLWSNPNDIVLSP